MKGNKIKFNLVDIFICVIFLFVIIFYSLYLFNISYDNSDSLYNDYYDVVIEAEKLKLDYIDNIKIGDPVIDSDGNVLGEVSGFEISDFYYSPDESSLETVSHPDFRNLKITFKCEMTSEEDYFVFGKNKIVIGDVIDVFIPSAYVSGRCVSVTKI